MRYLSVILVAFLLMAASVSAGAQDVTPTSDAIVASDVMTPTADILDPVVDVSDTLSPVTVATTDAVTVDSGTLESNIPIPQDEVEAIAQAGEAISAFTVGSWLSGVLLLIGIAVFAYRKYFMKKA